MNRIQSFFRVIVLLGTVIPAIGFGQSSIHPDTSSTTSLNLQDCFRLAIENNPRLKISNAEWRSSQLSRDEFGKSRLPSISLNAGASYAPHSDKAGYDPVSTNGGEVSGQLELDQQIYDGGIKNLKLSQFQIDVEKAELQHRIAIRDLRYDVEIAFVEMLRSREALFLREEGVTQLLRYQTLANQLGQSGQVGAADLLRARVELANAVIARDQAKSSAQVAILQLRDLVGIPPGQHPTFGGDLSALVQLPDTSRVAAADTLSPLDVSVAQQSVERSRIDRDIGHRELLPSISVQGATGFLSSVDNLQLPREERVVPFGFAAGVTLSMPLFTWGASDIRAQESEIAIESQRDQLSLAQRTHELQLRIAFLELHEGESRLANIDSSLQSADEAYRLTVSKYAGGGALSLELISAQQLLAETRMNRLEALADIQRSRARIEQLQAHR